MNTKLVKLTIPKEYKKYFHGAEGFQIQGFEDDQPIMIRFGETIVLPEIVAKAVKMIAEQQKEEYKEHHSIIKSQRLEDIKLLLCLLLLAFAIGLYTTSWNNTPMPLITYLTVCLASTLMVFGIIR